MNPLYQSMNQSNNIFNQINDFKSSFTGDAKSQVEAMLKSGRISQQQYDAAVQKANQLFNMMK